MDPGNATASHLLVLRHHFWIQKTAGSPCRIYYTGEPGNFICIDEIIEIVNENQEQTATPK